jgi:hypothetical protein
VIEQESSIPARVVVALDALRRDLGVLELAAGLAARKRTPLLALLVEDANLFNLAGLPFSKEIDRYSGAERALNQLRILRVHRSRAEQVRRALERLNERLSIEVGFKTVRGHFGPGVLAEIAQIDILFLGRKAETPPKAGRGSEAPPVWAVSDGSPDSQYAVRLAAELAAAEGCGLWVALAAETEADSELLRRAVGACLAGATARLVPVQPFDSDRLLRRLHRTGCRLLVMKKRDGETVGDIADAAACPVVLV